MKCTELAAKLLEFAEKHGDLPVVYTAHRYDNPDDSVGITTEYDIQEIHLDNKRNWYRYDRGRTPKGKAVCVAGWL